MKKLVIKTMVPIVILFSVLFTISCSNTNKSKLPNMVYVLADDLGYGDISSFNENSKILTPNIDKLASEGMRFTDAHTSSSVCTPTRYGILTGRYNWRSKLKSGVLTGKSKALIPNTRTTVASMLKKHGYNTAFIGKWHLGWDWALKDSMSMSGEGWDAKDFDNIDFSKPVKNTPNDLGFDYSYGHSGSLDMAPYVYVENGMATQVPETTTINTGKYSWWREGPTSSDFIHDEVTPNFFRKAVSYISKQAITESPFFLYLALPSPHTPILPTEKWQSKSGLNPYGDFVMMVDDFTGKLDNAIKKSGIEENTIIIFTSDNGCSPAAKIDELTSKDHYPSYIYRGHKADIYEGGHRVPYIIRWPNKIKKGTISKDLICTTDLLATCADIIGYSLKDNEGEDSFSMLPFLEEKELNKQSRLDAVHHSINGSFAIRKGDWKLIMCPGSGGWSFPRPNDKAALEGLPETQLYNLASDPAESNNLVESNPSKAKELKQLLIKYIEEGRSTPGTIQKNDSIDFQWKQIDFNNL